MTATFLFMLQNVIQDCWKNLSGAFCESFNMYPENCSYGVGEQMNKKLNLMRMSNDEHVNNKQLFLNCVGK